MKKQHTVGSALWVCWFCAFVVVFVQLFAFVCFEVEQNCLKIVCAWLWEEFSVKDTYMEAETFTQHEIT